MVATSEGMLRVETPEGEFDIPKGPLTGSDQVPIAKEQRCISGWAATMMGFAMDVSVPFFMICFSGVVLGLNWMQVIGFTALSQALIASLYMTNNWGGGRFAIAFPTQVRAIFGNFAGTRVATVIRSIVAILWYAVQNWLAALAITIVLDLVWPAYADWQTMFFKTFMWFGIVTAAQYWTVHYGYRSIRWVAAIGGPICAAVIIIAMGWAYMTEGTLGPLYTDAQYLVAAGPKQVLMFMSIVMGASAVGWVNISDMSRALKSTKDTLKTFVLGTTLGFTTSAFIAVTAASLAAHWGMGLEWNPIYWCQHYPSVWLAITMLVLIAASAITTNPMWNLINPIVTITNLAPHRINWRKAAIIASAISIGCFPWYLLSGEGANFMTFLTYLGAWNGSIACVMMVDYFWVKKRRIDLPALYERFGRYEYWRGGINWYAVIAFAIGVSVGYTVGIDYSFFAGSPVAGLAYYLLMRFAPTKQTRRAYVEEATASM